MALIKNTECGVCCFDAIHCFGFDWEISSIENKVWETGLDDNEIGCLDRDHYCTGERIQLIKEWIGNISIKMNDNLKKIFEKLDNCVGSFFKPDCTKCERSK